MGICICGNNQFFARQRCYADIIVDGNSDFIEEVNVTDCDPPYGPYVCTKCGREYDELPDK